MPACQWVYDRVTYVLATGTGTVLTPMQHYMGLTQLQGTTLLYVFGHCICQCHQHAFKWMVQHADLPPPQSNDMASAAWAHIINACCPSHRGQEAEFA